MKLTNEIKQNTNFTFRYSCETYFYDDKEDEIVIKEGTWEVMK